jgi:hypothetical protein
MVDNFDILNQYPQIEFSYETETHKKIPSNYSICFAIPHAKKFIVWFIFHGGCNKCVLMELNRNKNFSKITVLKESFDLSPLYLGTVVFGSLMADDSSIDNILVIEDVLMYEGVSLNRMIFGKKLGVIEAFLNQQLICDNNKPPISFMLPVFWKSHINEEETTQIPLAQISYPLHHIQYRSLDTIVPYLNVIPGSDGNHIKINSTPKNRNVIMSKTKVKKSYNEQTNYISTFLVKADLQTDVYNLFGYDENMLLTLYDIAYIPNYKSSVYMNSIFRNIKENSNLDFIEESDDEDDFEDTREDKYVNLELEVVMDCVYHTKFRRWVPIKIVYGGTLKVISLLKLPKL